MCLLYQNFDFCASIFRISNKLTTLSDKLLGAENQPDSQHHMALQVDDAQASRLLMKEKGFDIQETILIPGTDRFFVRDPDGNLIEIIEWQEEYPNIPVSSDN